LQKNKLYVNRIKRLLDIILSLMSLIILSPLLVIVGIIVRVKLGSPVIFKQPRPGMNEKIFYMYKFRSMTNEKGSDGRLLPDEQRLTRFGRFIRTSSLDELLELVNILKGEMSIVGPRPLSMYYLPHYPSKYRHRHDVRPGLTGLAQVSGRNNLPWEERFYKDTYYVNNVSFVLDIKIILRTVLKVLKRTDISVRGTNSIKDYGCYITLEEENGSGKKLSGMTYSEIGSFFWLEESDCSSDNLLSKDSKWLPFSEDSCYTFSGRNAIDIVLKDILNEKKVTKVYVPSYSCVSMIQPFIDYGLKVTFYEVEYKDGFFSYHYPRVDEHTIVLVMSYFGLDTSKCHSMIDKLKTSKAIIIEDITHSMLHNNASSPQSDYYVASLRKWFAIPSGGWAGKRKGDFIEKPSLNSNHAVEDKILGMQEKYKYLRGEFESKEEFLLKQSRFENDLIHVDRMLKIDDISMEIIKSIDVNAVILRRRRNMKVLLDGLYDLTGKAISLPAVDINDDTPLFLPIFLENEDRNALREYLINKGIYCPIHWPEIMGAKEGVRANELSLICDQRYTEEDMKVIVNEIHIWFQDYTS